MIARFMARDARIRWPGWVGPAMAFCLSGLLFWRLVKQRQGDIWLHLRMIQESLATGEWLPNSLYFRLVALCAGFSESENALAVGSVIVLATAVAAKLWLSQFIVSSHILGNSARERMWLIAGACALVLLSFSFPVSGNVYLGQIPPNVWHNSTTIAVAPLALGLFWASYRWIERPTGRLLLGMAILVLGNAFVKPSFLFCWIPAFPAMAILQRGADRRAVKAVIIAFAALAVVGLQYWMLFEGPRDEGTFRPEGAGVVIAPLVIWSGWAESPLRSLLASTAFPLSVAIANWKRASRSTFFVYAALCLVAGVVVFATFLETGPRSGHGNFLWQAVLANYIWFLAGAAICLEELLDPAGLTLDRAWRAAPLAVLVAHAVAGFLYLARLFPKGEFM